MCGIRTDSRSVKSTGTLAARTTLTGYASLSNLIRWSCGLSLPRARTHKTWQRRSWSLAGGRCPRDQCTPACFSTTSKCCQTRLTPEHGTSAACYPCSTHWCRYPRASSPTRRCSSTSCRPLARWCARTTPWLLLTAPLLNAGSCGSTAEAGRFENPQNRMSAGLIWTNKHWRLQGSTG